MGSHEWAGMVIGGWRGLRVVIGSDDGPLLLVRCSYPNGATLDHVARRVRGGFRSVSRERFFLPEERCVVLGAVELGGGGDSGMSS